MKFEWEINWDFLVNHFFSIRIWVCWEGVKWAARIDTANNNRTNVDSMMKKANGIYTPHASRLSIRLNISERQLKRQNVQSHSSNLLCRVLLALFFFLFLFAADCHHANLAILYHLRYTIPLSWKKIKQRAKRKHKRMHT